MLKGRNVHDLRRAALSASLLIFVLTAWPSTASSEDRDPFHFPISYHKRIRDRAIQSVLQDLKLNVPDKKMRSWRKQMNRANLYQDFVRFFWSRTHFDNCTFDDGIAQIRRIQGQMRDEYKELELASNNNRRDKHRKKIIFKTGLIVHSVQDFFSHSNFVELSQQNYTSISDVPTVDLWNHAGQESIRNMARNGLISSYFLLSFPKKCSPKPKMPLSKDKSKNRAGKAMTVWVRPGKSDVLNGHEAAMLLAERATYKIFYELFTTYPLLTSAEHELPTAK